MIPDHYHFTVEISFQQSSYSFCEGEGTVEVCVNINGGTQDPVPFTLSIMLSGAASEFMTLS